MFDLDTLGKMDRALAAMTTGAPRPIAPAAPAPVESAAPRCPHLARLEAEKLCPIKAARQVEAA